MTIHGHTRAYVRAGRGPVLLLIHGLGCDHRTWLPVLPALSRHFTVVAPDLLGHGRSAKPRTDYTVAGYANGMRDLLSVLGIERATVVGHSFGGGVAMQLAYQFPERVERLCLVAPGGIGPEVSMLLRLASLPGAGCVLGALASTPARLVGGVVLSLLSRTGLPQLRDTDALAEVYDGLSDHASRTAFRHVLRGVVDWRGQIITVADRAYLTRHVPLCVVWGDRDGVVPPRHAQLATQHAPDARVEVLTDAGHFPHRDRPARFAEIVHQFVAETRPAAHRPERWRSALRRGPAPPQLDDGTEDRPARGA